MIVAEWSSIADTAPCYNRNRLGIGLAVGRRTLDPLGQVRILDPQPIKVIELPNISRQIDG